MAYLSQIIRLSCENCHDNREENLGFYHVSQFGVAFNSRNTSFFFCLVLGYVTVVRQGNLMDSGLIHAFIER